jgi:histo-blood group ABO system transferase
MKVLLHIIATNKYDRYIPGIIESARKYFLTDQEVKFVVYTDSEDFINSEDPDLVAFKISHEPWPGPTLKRFHYFSLAMDLIKENDLSFYIDVDSLFVKNIGISDLGISDNFEGMIGTLHPGYYGDRGTPEYRPESLAYIPFEVNNMYFCGGFFGGSSLEFAKAISTMRDNIDSDFARGIIAIWHDESHLNRYFVDNKPKSILGMGFSCPEERRLKEYYFMDPYIIFLDKAAEIKIEKGQDAN